jgi:hypothetical protein
MNRKKETTRKNIRAYKRKEQKKTSKKKESI